MARIISRLPLARRPSTFRYRPKYREYAAYIGFAQRRTGREHNHAIRDARRIRKHQPGVRVVRPVRLHVVAARPEILPRKHVLGVENRDQPVARNREIFADLRDDVLEVVALRLAVIKQADSP